MYERNTAIIPIKINTGSIFIARTPAGGAVKQVTTAVGRSLGLLLLLLTGAAWSFAGGISASMLKLCAFLLVGGVAHANKLALTPPMGWMSWEVFRCRTDCSGTNAGYCVDETTYKAQADALVSGGFRAAGYKTISIDDCWEQKSPERDAQGRLAPDPKRFPSGFKALADYMHKQNVSFGIYSDMGTHTCGGYPGTEGHEEIDAKTFAEWGVDYLKLDGCNVVAPVIATLSLSLSLSLSLPPSLPPSLPLSRSILSLPPSLSCARAQSD